MSQEDGPPRLKISANASPELHRALYALGQDDASSPHLARVADRLGHLLDAPPGGPAPAGTFLRNARRKLLATRFVVASCAIGATAVWLSRSPPSPESAPARTVIAQPHRAPTPAAVEPEPVEPVSAPPELAPEAAAEPVVVPTESPVLTPPAHGHTRRARTSGRAHGLAASPQGAVTEATVAAELEQPAPSQVEVDVPAPAPAAAAVRQQTEAELLFDARRQIMRDPRAALRLVEQHAARFPDGLLAPEREVLAIEALRKLGQTAAAARRLQLFRARYPDSLHLRRLDRKPD